MSTNKTTEEIFFYENLKKKALREIERLVKALKFGEYDEALDHALNGAFTIFHLFEWCEKTYPGKRRRPYDVCVESSNPNLKILHDIVTYNKHAVVKNYLAGEKQVPKIDKELKNLCTEKGVLLVTENDVPLVLAIANVYFGDVKAIDVLPEAWKEFEIHEKKLIEATSSTTSEVS